MTKKSKSSAWLHKLQFRYRVSLLNEHTLEEVWYFRLSRLGVIIYLSAFTLITFVLLTLLIIFTPIRYYLPGYTGNESRRNIIDMSIGVDSLALQTKLHAQYINTIREIMSGEIKPDTIETKPDSAAFTQGTKDLIEKSEVEKQFTTTYEQTEKYNIQTTVNNVETESKIFYSPVKGVITSAFAPNENQNGIFIATSSNELVICVQEGTVTYTAFTFDFGWVIHVQHSNNYVSIYKNNTSILKKSGDKVKSGEAIAITGSDSSQTASNGQFYFELWVKGKPVNPEEVIIF